MMKKLRMTCSSASGQLADSVFYAELITLAREARGLTQQVLAKRSGVSQGLLSKIENGLREADESVVEKIAVAVDLPKSFFSQKAEIPAGIPLHRRRKSMSKKMLHQIEAGARIANMRLGVLLESAEIELRIPPEILEGDWEPDECARALRYSWKIPRGPVKNVVELVEKAGIVIIRSDFGSTAIDGFYVPGNSSVIFVNSRFPMDRQRFTIAHELGHMIMHASGIYGDTEEQEANGFAAEFLMPTEDAYEDLSSGLSLSRLAELKTKWRVSMAFLIVRATSLGCISDRQKRTLWMKMGAAGYRKREPIDLPFEPASLMSKFIRFYMKELKYSVKDMCQLLHIDEPEFQAEYLGLSIV